MVNDIAIIGGGPAGMMAAETALKSGSKVTLYEANPSLGRKFLVAGKSGLNITNAAEEPFFLTQYEGNTLPAELLNSILTEFSNKDTTEWLKQFDIETFISAGNKVFPTEMKAGALLKKWREHLLSLGVEFKFNHKLTGIKPNEKAIKLKFQTSAHTSEEACNYSHDKAIIALGGASWQKTGSNGKWVELLHKLSIKTHPLTPANCGWEVEWPTELLQEVEGLPLKNLAIKTVNTEILGELVITKYGLEGGPIYKLGSQLRTNPVLKLDFKPTFTAEQLKNKIPVNTKRVFETAIRHWKLSAAASAILAHYHHAQHCSIDELVTLTKNCEILCTRPRPIDEAISTAGGICWNDLTPNLNFNKYPNLYACGEMLDWEAPTGGFLLQACFATGVRAGTAASLAQ